MFFIFISFFFPSISIRLLNIFLMVLLGGSGSIMRAFSRSKHNTTQQIPVESRLDLERSWKRGVKKIGLEKKDWNINRSWESSSGVFMPIIDNFFFSVRFIIFFRIAMARWARSMQPPIYTPFHPGWIKASNFVFWFETKNTTKREYMWAEPGETEFSVLSVKFFSI